MWARVHKLDRVKPQPGGGAIIVIDDERSIPAMQRVPSLSTLVAVARVLAARRALDAKFGGKGEVHYAAIQLPSFLSEAVVCAGAAVVERGSSDIIVPARPSGVVALIDIAFSDLSRAVRLGIGTHGVDVDEALKQLEARLKLAPIDRDAKPEQYWRAVFEIAALVGEQARRRGGRWIETKELPVPFAMKFPDGALSHPMVIAQQVVEGREVEA